MSDRPSTQQDRLYAHSHQDRPKEEWQPLLDHLLQVAELAERHASAFGAGEWGRLAGLWHDLGKADPAFQRRISDPNSTERVEHSLAGALLARERYGATDALPLAFAIAGHHAGLANLQTIASAGGPTPLLKRLDGGTLDALRPHLSGSLGNLLQEPAPTAPPWFADRTNKSKSAAFLRRFELWTRFLFSALVDADYLDTEAFYRGEARRRETAGFATPAQLGQRLDSHLEGLVRDLDPAVRDSSVNRARSTILEACRCAALLEPGIFSLTVPTGGGKTLSAMAFALAHAEKHGLRRVIAAIPYTSILEQNARVYRNALGPEQVIEHHSNLDPDTELVRNKLACENWDAPVVVTTNVQLFESLLANRASRCRKLHNVARSVLLLDEVQTLPPDLLAPVLDVLRELVATFGCTVVLSTATQPAFEKEEEAFPEGLERVHEIAPEPKELAARLRRFEVEWPAADAEPVAWPRLAQAVEEHSRVLAVVHLRKDARALAQLLPQEGLFHLSALMCAAHRSAVLDEIKQRLRSPSEVCRVVSTQLIEAGVDVDFPIVFRALAGLDSVVQAGGRCNREGRLPGLGRLVVFRAPTQPPPGILRHGLEAMETLLQSRGSDLDVLDPDVIATYFRLLFMKIERDRLRVQEARARLAFADVDARFRMIDDAWSQPLVVPWGDALRRLDRVRDKGPTRDNLRGLQPFTVNVSERDLGRLRGAGAIDATLEPILSLTQPYLVMYEDMWGLVIPEEGPTPDPGSLIL